MRRILNQLQRFRRDDKAVGAVEFALIVPVLLTLYIGGVDITRAIIFSHKMQNATVAVNDLVTQASELTKGDVEKTFDAADAMLAQYRSGTIHIRVTTIHIDANGKAKVQWSVARGMARTASNSSYTMEGRLASLRDYTLIITETEHAFQPLLSYVFSSSFPLAAEARGRFRGRDAVSCLDCTS